MIEIKITGTTAHEIESFFSELATKFGYIPVSKRELHAHLPADAQMELPLKATPAPEGAPYLGELKVEDKEIPAPKKSPGRPKKEKTPPPTETIPEGTLMNGEIKEMGKSYAEPAGSSASATTSSQLNAKPDAPPAGASTEEAKSYTKEDAVAALQDVAGKKGMPACQAILSKFNARRISEVTADKYNDFVTECQQAVSA